LSCARCQGQGQRVGNPFGIVFQQHNIGGKPGNVRVVVHGNADQDPAQCQHMPFLGMDDVGKRPLRAEGNHALVKAVGGVFVVKGDAHRLVRHRKRRLGIKALEADQCPWRSPYSGWA